jgi:hypothetical protein
MASTSQFNASDPYHRYYDITLTNAYNPTLTGNTNIDLVFNEVRQNPIVLCPEEWFMSVVRFSIETPTLPVFIPQALLGQADPNKLVYSFTLSVVSGGNTYYGKANWIYIPQDTSLAVANAPAITQQNSQYYYVNTFSAMTLMMNKAWSQAYANLLSALSTAGQTALPSNSNPFMVYDAGASKWSILFPQYLNSTNPPELIPDNYDPNSGGTRLIKAYMNTASQVLLSSFPTTYLGNGTEQVANGTNYQFQVYNNNNQNLISNVYPAFPSAVPIPYGSSGTSVDCLLIEQDYSTTTLWNPVQNIVFTTSLVPVEPSLGTAPQIFNYYNGSANNLTGSTPNESNVLVPIMTDLEVQATTGDGWKPTIQYLPRAEYRLMDLRGSYPVHAIEIGVFWKDSYGVLNRFQLAPACSASIKIMFRRKDYQTARMSANY